MFGSLLGGCIPQKTEVISRVLTMQLMGKRRLIGWGERLGWVGEKNEKMSTIPPSRGLLLLLSAVICLPDSFHTACPSSFPGWNDPIPDIDSFLAF